MKKNVALYLRRVAIGKLVAVAIAASTIALAMAQDASPSVNALASEFVEASIRLQAMDMEADAEAWNIVSKARAKALIALAFAAPTNVTELAHKLAAITEFSEDTERWSLRVVVEDALALAEAEGSK